MKYSWHKGKLLPGQAQQVYGFVVTEDDLVVLVRDKGEERFTPVGGGVEANEAAQDAFIRELKEEAQLQASDIHLLGTVEVKDEENGSDRELQVRYACRPEKIEEFIPCKDGFEVQQRIFVHIDELPRYVKWLNTPDGEEMFEALKEYISK